VACGDRGRAFGPHEIAEIGTAPDAHAEAWRIVKADAGPNFAIVQSCLAGRSIMLHQRVVAALALVAGLAGAAAAAAQDYPTRPVRVVVGFGPGASGDIAARVLAQKLGQILGQQFIVENRTGAASNIATNYVAKAPKDGYTLLQATVANTISAALTPNLPYDLTKDFAPISLFATVPNLVVVHPSVGVKDITGLIRLAREKPDGLAFGSAGVGSGSHFSGELFNVMAGIKLVHVPYPGTAQAVTDLLAGRVQVVFSPASSALQFVEEGRIIALASTGAKRTNVAPDVPTVSESGLPGYDTSGWFGLLAPTGVLHDIIDRLAGATREAVKSRDVYGPLQQQGMDVETSTSEEFAAYIAADMAKWARTAAGAGVKR
jgi:tripartite-type tricarboxylate transporter receptor subunit TctC